MKFVYNICLFVLLQVLFLNKEISFIYSSVNSFLFALNSCNNFYNTLIVILLYLDSYFDLNYSMTFFLIYNLLPLIDIIIYTITIVFNIYLLGR